MRVPSAARQTRAAFTLVELLVVIGILSILAALVTPAIFQARVSARNAAIKAEIDMLHMAIMNYKNEYGSFPPAFDATPLPPASPTASAIMASHILRAFPRTKTSMPDNRPTSDQRLAIFDTSTSTNPTRITNGLVFWLQGFTPDITDPLGVTSSAKRAKLFDFDESRILQVPVGTATRFSYHPADKPGSPYVYLPASQYGALPYAGASNYGAMRQTTSGDSQPFFNAGQEYFNPDTFQILCAGLDEQWGTEDDLSNFWPGTRQDYLDSLE